MKISVFSSSFLLLFVLSLFISSCVGLTLSPTSLSKQSGSYSTAQPLSVLSTKDLSGSADDWDKYIEFYGNSQVFRGTFSFDVSSVVNVVSAFSLKVNYKGPTKANQVWTWEWYNPTTNTYVVAGDNTGATNWVWSSLSFNGPLPFANYVSTSKVLQVRFSSATVADNCNIDFLQLDVTTTTSVPSTSAPTTTPTSAPTTKPTSVPTTKPTSAPTTKPTSAPTTKPTSAPTTKPTSAPTTKPTSAPTTKPTSQPTNAPTTGRKCPAGKRYVPQPGTTFHIQYTETINYNKNVQVYNIDMFDSATVANVNALHARGVAVICYFSSQYESWRSDASKFTSNILGSPLDEWPGERWVDIRTQTLRNIMTDRLDIAVARGCDGVDVDNVDEYTNSNGLGLTYADQLNFNIFMANEAHARGLSIGLKNDLDQIEDLVSYYDFAVNEQCNQYNECNYMDPFVQDNKAVFGIEYSGSVQTFCPKMNLKDFTFVYKALSLNEASTNCCTYEQGGCTNSATYRCE